MHRVIVRYVTNAVFGDIYDLNSFEVSELEKIISETLDVSNILLQMVRGNVRENAI